MRRTVISLGLCGLALACMSCSGEELLTVYPVEGDVQLDGAPVPGALVALHPVDASVAVIPVATVGQDGKFQVNTYGASDGAPAGQYTVTVAWYKLVGEGNSQLPGRNVVPLKYTKPETSPLKVTVNEGPTNLGTLSIASKSEGEQK